jgi:general secretion pathway protein K
MAQPHRNQKGAALLMALFAVVLITFLAVEISYETAVEYRVATADYQRLKAYYAAKSGIELSLLRIQLYQQVLSQYGDQIKGGAASQFVDMIWQFPFAWPPASTADMGTVSKSELEKSVSESLMDAQYITQISSEGGKLDINDLGSPSKALRESTRERLLQLIQNKYDSDDKFREKNRNINPEEIVNDIQDWVDQDKDSLNGGSEEGRYPDANSEFIPPSRPFKTLDELKMVRGISDELYSVIAPNVTAYGLKGVNVNYAEKAILKSIDKQIDDRIAEEILKRRGDQTLGPFADQAAFESFLGTQGVNMSKFNEQQIPLYFDPETNFRIVSTGFFGRSTREIIAIVYDFDTVKSRLEKLMTTTVSTTTSTTLAGQAATTTPTSTTTSTTVQKKKGTPQIIYWHEE